MALRGPAASWPTGRKKGTGCGSRDLDALAVIRRHLIWFVGSRTWPAHHDHSGRSTSSSTSVLAWLAHRVMLFVWTYAICAVQLAPRAVTPRTARRSTATPGSGHWIGVPRSSGSDFFVFGRSSSVPPARARVRAPRRLDAPPCKLEVQVIGQAVGLHHRFAVGHGEQHAAPAATRRWSSSHVADVIPSFWLQPA